MADTQLPHTFCVLYDNEDGDMEGDEVTCPAEALTLSQAKRQAGHHVVFVLDQDGKILDDGALVRLVALRSLN